MIEQIISLSTKTFDFSIKQKPHPAFLSDTSGIITLLSTDRMGL
jgi:hypothetical protein